MTDDTNVMERQTSLSLAQQGESLAAALLVRLDAPERSLEEMKEIAVELRQLLLVLRRREDLLDNGKSMRDWFYVLCTLAFLVGCAVAALTSAS